MFTEAFRRLLVSVSPPAAVRGAEKMAAGSDAEAGSGPPPLWARIRESGFLDALLPEKAGGAGLPLDDFHPLAFACGETALPAPFAETAVARWLLARRGVAAPADAAIILAPPSAVLPLAAHATHALVPGSGIGDARADGVWRWSLVPVRLAGQDPFRCGGGSIDVCAPALLEVPAEGEDLLVIAASLAAARMAGGMARLLDMTMDHANTRQQFGRPLAGFQAIQHQVAVMAERLVSATAASRIGLSGSRFDPLRGAVAKCCTSEAAHDVAAIAHAVHGAIGATADHDLQLHIRRLKQLQLAFGGADYWARRIGQARLAAPDGTGADFIRTHLQAGIQA